MLSNDSDSFEDILETYSNEEISAEEEVYILELVGRLRRTLKWDLFEDVYLFDKSRGPEVIRDILAHFIRWKTYTCDTYNLPDIVGMQHLIVYTLAELCFYYKINNSNMVASILRLIYSCDGHFSSMFANIINGHHRSMLQPSPNRETREKEHLTMLYFLSHAQRARLQFGGTRFMDLRLRLPLKVPPSFLAAICNRPNVLLLLLRHGASLESRSARGGCDYRLLMRHLVRIVWDTLGSDFNDWNMALLNRNLTDAWECLRILLRVIPQVSMEDLNFHLMGIYQTDAATPCSSHEFMRTLSQNGLLPHLVHRYTEPSELQHLCRCSIRESLGENWNLPHGIQSLSLPKPIQIYIDLLED